MTATMLGSVALGDFDGIDLDMLLRQGFRPVHVLEIRALTPEVFTVELDLSADDDAAAPGAHIEVAVPLPDGPAIRHYSLVTVDGNSMSGRIAILREADGRGGSAWLHEHLLHCTSLLVRGPRDTFGYLGDGPSFFVAGGIGITPITAMAAAAAAAGIDWHLLYIGRRQETMAFADELVRTYGTDRVTVHATEADGRPDVVDLARRWARHHSTTSPVTTVYTCGPASLMDALEFGFADDPEITVVSEDFLDETGPDSPRTKVRSNGNPAATSASEESGDHPFVVELGDGSEVEVPVGSSIIDALGDAGVRTLSSCQKGTCGTCETVILDGEAEHRDSVLSPDEHAAQETMMICVSRACGDRIALDL